MGCKEDNSKLVKWVSLRLEVNAFSSLADQVYEVVGMGERKQS